MLADSDYGHIIDVERIKGMFEGNILVVAAHPDDEALGCGGTIAKLSKDRRVDILFISDGETARGNSDNIKQRRRSACDAAKCLGAQSPSFLNFPDNQLDTVPFLSIVKEIEDVIEQNSPSVVFTHFRGDLNIDHRITHNAVMTACRPLPGGGVKEIYAMEVLSSTEWALGEAFIPNVFVDVTNSLRLKYSALEFYSEEMREAPHARSFEAVEAQAILRGASVGVKYAESFSLIRKLV